MEFAKRQREGVSRTAQRLIVAMATVFYAEAVLLLHANAQVGRWWPAEAPRHSHWRTNMPFAARSAGFLPRSISANSSNNGVGRHGRRRLRSRGAAAGRRGARLVGR